MQGDVPFKPFNNSISRPFCNPQFKFSIYVKVSYLEKLVSIFTHIYLQDVINPVIMCEYMI